ncbi:hypothetical protein BGZ90_000744 [Linnemannia elongata]|nr:hypothetical protein BGZ90_000744 [Linnemannia elongata]
MDNTSLLDLPPEMRSMVMSLLYPHELAACALVSQTWNKVFTPLLWRQVEDPVQKRRRMGGVDRAAIEGGLKRYGAFIQSLRLVTDMLYMDKFLEMCPPTFPLLTSLWIDSVSTGDEDHLIALLKRCTAGLKKVVYCLRGEKWGCFEFDTAASALIEHADTLEVFRLEGDYVSSAKPINRLLCSLPNLKEFSILSDRLRGRGGALDAREILKSDWICSNLEVFRCEINYIPRPDITRKIAGQPAYKWVKRGTFQESMDLQRQIYAKLAKFTKLRKLSLGFPVNLSARRRRYVRLDDLMQFDCLAMTLESGLDLLKDLKELEEVELYLLEFGIRSYAEEVEWMKTNWPKAIVGRTYHSPEQESNDTDSEDDLYEETGNFDDDFASGSVYSSDSVYSSGSVYGSDSDY